MEALHLCRRHEVKNRDKSLFNPHVEGGYKDNTSPTGAPYDSETVPWRAARFRGYSTARSLVSYHSERRLS